ncbi:MAG: type II toxin-antitoxin system PemK/MazF family toxin, partial [Anaerolineae bacterium]|nr:type II toxin-antitoxin system PemK/MazF family toxin [Anaerolineae bacterium]
PRLRGPLPRSGGLYRRLPFPPLPETPTLNGLRQTSQVMVDKIVTLPRERIGGTVGVLEADALLQVTRLLALWLGMA